MTAVTEQTEDVLTTAHLPHSGQHSSDLAHTRLDAAGLATLISQHQADIWRYLRYLGAEAADADDLTQETFLALSRAKFQERSGAQTGAYLRTIARNQLLMLRRFQGRDINTVELEAAEQVWASSAGDSGMDGLLATLAECLETLEGRAREAVQLFYRENLSRAAIASALTMKPEGIKTLLRRTREMLRDCIQRRTENKQSQ
jgi:RNA polymerase sigma-70 factor (ECF subfamily)